MGLLERSAELAAVVRADVAFQDVQAASGLRNDQRGGEDGHVVPGCLLYTSPPPRWSNGRTGRSTCSFPNICRCVR